MKTKILTIALASTVFAVGCGSSKASLGVEKEVAVQNSLEFATEQADIDLAKNTLKRKKTAEAREAKFISEQIAKIAEAKATLKKSQEDLAQHNIGTHEQDLIDLKAAKEKAERKVEAQSAALTIAQKKSISDRVVIVKEMNAIKANIAELETRNENQDDVVDQAAISTDILNQNVMLKILAKQYETANNSARPAMDSYNQSQAELSKARTAFTARLAARTAELEKKVADAEGQPARIELENKQNLVKIQEEVSNELANISKIEKNLQNKYSLDLNALVKLTPKGLRTFNAKRIKDLAVKTKTDTQNVNVEVENEELFMGPTLDHAQDFMGPTLDHAKGNDTL